MHINNIITSLWYILHRSHQNIRGWVTPLGHGERHSAHWTGRQLGWGQRGQGEFGWGGVSFSVQYGRGGDFDSASVFKEGGVKCGGWRAWRVVAYPDHVQCYCWNQSKCILHFTAGFIVLNSCDNYTWIIENWNLKRYPGTSVVVHELGRISATISAPIKEFKLYQCPNSNTGSVILE